jgi:hypothetical protein
MWPEKSGRQYHAERYWRGETLSGCCVSEPTVRNWTILGERRRPAWPPTRSESRNSL